jgi:dTDP-4-amino-4,6-dideoxygalactose transaminase
MDIKDRLNRRRPAIAHSLFVCFFTLGFDRHQGQRVMFGKEELQKRLGSVEESGCNEEIPILRPLLPTSDFLLPYLRRIDAARLYTNYGPLVGELSDRLAGCLTLHKEAVTCASSGTAAIVGAILATAGRATKSQPLALMPAFTFVATPVAAELCGFEPYFIDINPSSWMLDPALLAAHPMLDRVGLVVPVAPFGRPLPQAPWREFQKQTGIPVVIDGAASFDQLLASPRDFVGSIPVAMSFHATKAFATGEGGCVASTDEDLIAHVVRALNFGFYGARDSLAPSTNGKLSEYHAAVGLAELDHWSLKYNAALAVTILYRHQLTDAGLVERFVGAPEISVSYNLFQCRDLRESRIIQKRLAEAGIGWRLWYGTGLHNQTYYKNMGHDALPVTEAIAPCLLGLPTGPDLTAGQVSRIVAILAAGVEAAA